MLKNKLGEFKYRTIRKFRDNFAKLFFNYSDHDLTTNKNLDWFKNDHFQKAYQLSKDTESWNVDFPWRAYIVYSYAKYAMKLEGDFVECGVNRGAFARGLIEYANFANNPSKKMILFDTFEGIVPEQLTGEEIHQLKKNDGYKSYEDTYDYVKELFKEYNVTIIKGVVPESLNRINIDKVAYLSIDMNCVYPEREALSFFWPKVVSGGIIILDDHGHIGYENQKRSNDEFFAEKGLDVLCLPTGQGVVIKP